MDWPKIWSTLLPECVAIGGILADGSNAVYDWGEPERLLDHAPEQLAAAIGPIEIDASDLAALDAAGFVIGVAEAEEEEEEEAEET